jgi:plastocyanin
MPFIPAKLAATGLMSALIMAVAACGGATTDPTPTPTPASTPTAPAGETPEGQGSPIQNFTLQDLSVPVGSTVTWTNLDGAAHTVTAGVPGEKTGEFDSGRLANGATFSQTFAQAGTVAYFCAIHPSMRGTVTVQNTDGAGAGAEPASDAADFDDGY